MRIRNFLTSFCVASVLTGGMSAQAQLPDLRGKTLFVTGTLHVEGTVTILFQTTTFNENITLDEASPAKIILSSTGPEDNSVLTGTLPLPPVVTPPYPVCGNPNVPVSVAFNRNTGAFTVTGLLTGDSEFDFGVQEITGAGTFRIKVKMTDLGLTGNAAGTLAANGGLQIQQPGDTPFSYAIFGGTNGRPRLALVDPNTCTFGGLLQSNVSNSSLVLRNWTATLPSVSGTVTIEDCPGAANVPMTFTFHPSDNSGDFDVTVTPNADGTFTIPNLPAKSFTIRVKGANWLSKVAQADTSEGSVSGVSFGALKGGDANGDNSADVLDLDLLIQTFDLCLGDAGFIAGADFNCDNCADVLDLDILIRNFDQTGDEIP